MEPSDVFKGAVALIRSALRDRGFSSKGSTFWRKTDEGNTLLLVLQRSSGSSARTRRVTINYGTHCVRIATALGRDPADELDVWKAHWRKRLAESGRERWIEIGEDDSPQHVADQLLAAVLHEVLPDLTLHASDTQLREEWFSGASPGVGNMQRLLFLAILLRDIGPPESLIDIVAELRTLVSGSVHAALVEHDLKRAGLVTP